MDADRRVTLSKHLHALEQRISDVKAATGGWLCLQPPANAQKLPPRILCPLAPPPPLFPRPNCLARVLFAVCNVMCHDTLSHAARAVASTSVAAFNGARGVAGQQLDADRLQALKVRAACPPPSPLLPCPVPIHQSRAVNHPEMGNGGLFCRCGCVRSGP